VKREAKSFAENKRLIGDCGLQYSKRFKELFNESSQRLD
jgi:hypothetical protein